MGEVKEEEWMGESKQASGGRVHDAAEGKENASEEH